MLRRLYFAFPTAEQTRQVVAELELSGIANSRIHTIAKSDVNIAGLPTANEAQRKDQVWLWERVFWYGNLALFGVGAAALAWALYAGSTAWVITAAVVMLVTLVLGERFAVKVPHVHLSEMHVPLDHGEVVLMVDVPRARVREIEQLVSRHHPEAGLGGVGWSLSWAGI